MSSLSGTPTTHSGVDSTTLQQISEVAVGGVLVLLVLLVFIVSVKRVRARWRNPAAAHPELEHAHHVLAAGGALGDSVILVRLGERGAAPASGLDAVAIAALGPVVEHRPDRVLEGERECPVCLAEYLEKDKLRILDKCSHHFHQECIDAWLASNSSCPLCRTSLRQDKAAVPAPPPAGLLWHQDALFTNPSATPSSLAVAGTPTGNLTAAPPVPPSDHPREADMV